MTLGAPIDSRLVERFSRVLIGAVVIVSDELGRVAFIRQPRGPFAGAWLLPGGGLEIDEDAGQAASRETLEETGVTVSDLRYVGTYEVLGAWEPGPFHFVLLAFLGRAAADALGDGPGDGEGEMCWARPDELELHPTDLMMLTDAGAAAYPDSVVQARLTAERLRMIRYSTNHTGV